MAVAATFLELVTLSHANRDTCCKVFGAYACRYVKAWSSPAGVRGKGRKIRRAKEKGLIKAKVNEFAAHNVGLFVCL